VAAGPDAASLAGAGRRNLTLDGLRGIAVAAVVAQHAWPGLLPGGFAGVDMFFVLSGYLITRILVAELEPTGRINLWTFYARRVRRILPAALLAIVSTCLLYLVLLGPALPLTMRDEALAATFSVSNILFANRAVDYFAANPALSPFLHFWSLAVEEQFYLVWPTLLFVVSVLGRRGPERFRAWAPVVIVAVLAAGSLALAMRAAETTAFYLLPHRGWELMAGGLFAWLQLRGRMVLPERLAPYRAAGVAAGYALLAVVFVFAPSLGRWPGPATLLPVLGTVLLVAAGDAMPGARILTAAPLQFLGRISYALYLWHWPLLACAFLLALPAVDPPFWVALPAVAGAVVVATLSTRLLEEPIRSSRQWWLVGRRAVAGGLASMFAVGVLTASLLSVVPPTLAANDPFGAALAASRADRERLIVDRCSTTSARHAVRNCVYGAGSNPDGSPRRDVEPDRPVVVLFGDSHAMHWFPAINAWAKSRGLALVPLTRSGCPPTEAPTSAGTYNCNAWRKEALARLAELHPVLTVVSGTTGTPLKLGGMRVVPREGHADLWVDPTARMLDEVKARSQAILYVGDVPRPGFSVPDCLAAHRWAPSPCARPLADVMPATIRSAERQVGALAAVPFLDPSDWLCPDAECDWMAGDRVGWVDFQHLTSSAALSVLPKLAPMLDAEAGMGADGAVAAP
jgi:peptidoglycan/LPS O-acetylase OafA/YrhL